MGENGPQESVEKIWRANLKRILHFYNQCMWNFNMAFMCEREKFEIVQARKGKKWQLKINVLSEEINQLEMKKILLQSLENFNLVDFLPNVYQERILRRERNQEEPEGVKPKEKKGTSKLETAGVDQKK